MGLVKNLAQAGMFGIAGLAASRNKKKKEVLPPQPTMLSNVPMERPTSMIGTSRGGY